MKVHAQAQDIICFTCLNVLGTKLKLNSSSIAQQPLQKEKTPNEMKKMKSYNGK